ncbi:uncharacterized protein LOC111324875 [Stylophora pistillata]|nr:uncharacterized protein LOC111324875 [Stylophora pistillata]
MNFTWICYKPGESPEIDDPSSLPVVYPDGTSSASTGSGGCFNKGPGRLPFNDTSFTITFDNSLMVRGHTYYIILRVEKRQRFDYYTQKVAVAEAPPPFNISCTSANCERNAVINLRLELNAVCVGLSSKCSQSLTHKWFMYEKEKDGGGGWKETAGFYQALITSSTGRAIVLKENFLQKEMFYQIRFRTVTYYRGEGYSFYDFHTNSPPKLGTCKIDKSEGKAALDTFHLQCNDWYDTDLPLTYQVNIPKEDGTYIFLASETNNSIPLRLPVGNKSDGNRLQLEVAVIDSFLAFTKINLTVVVYTPSGEEFESQASGLTGEDSELEDIVNKGLEQNAVQLSIGILSAFNSLAQSNATTTDSSTVRENVINSITKLTINDTSNANQIASVLVEATKEEGGISPSSGLQALGACENMVSVLSVEKNNTESRDAVENAGKQIILVAGSLLGGAVLSSGSVNASQFGDVAKKAWSLTDTLAKVFLDRLLPGETPTFFQSPRVTMQLYRQHADEALPQSLEVGGGSFSLPSNLSLGNGSHSKIIDRNVQFSDLDPFIWQKNDTLKAGTRVVSLSFLDEHGNLIPVENSGSDIEINIPTKSQIQSQNISVNFVNPVNGTMAYHTFRVEHKDTAFSLRIVPFNESHLEVFLRHRKRPNKTHFDDKIILPDLTSCLPPEDENCTLLSRFMRCLGKVNVSSTYHDANFTKPGQPKTCGPKNDSVPTPAPSENGEDAFKCPDVCKYENLTYSNCSCDEIPNLYFLFNKTLEENPATCRNFTSFTMCPNDTLCKNLVNVLTCYALDLQRYRQCQEILFAPRKLFYDTYGRCLEDPLKVFFNTSFAKLGKWYVGVKPYIPPFVNHTKNAEDDMDNNFDNSGNHTDQHWWHVVLNMTKRKEVEKFLEESVVEEMNNHYNRTLKLKKCRWYNGKKCERIVSFRLWLWEEEMGIHNDYDNDDNDDEKDDDDDDRRRKGRSLSLTERDPESDVKARRLCIEVDEKPPPPKVGAKMELIEIPILDANVSTLYTFDVRFYTCLFWDELKEEWSTKGCKPGPNSTDEVLQCFCNHLTSFGGELFPPPSAIEFDTAFLGFASLGDTGNIGVIVAVGVFFFLYFIVAVFERKADKRDKERLSVSIPVRITKPGSHAYEIAVYTGMFGSSGTTANVSMMINAEKGETEILPLSCGKNPFSRGSVCSFVVRLPHVLGRLNYVRLWHDNSGPSPSWNLHQVVVRHVATGQKWFFMCNRWLAVEKDDGQIERVLFVADRKQLSGFHNLFYTRASKDIGDGHLWFSVYTRPPNSSFTRFQRLTCCISLLFSSMLVNAMFYEYGLKQQGLQVTFGPINFNWIELMTGIQSGLVVLPVNLLIISIFRYTGPKSSAKTKKFWLPHGFIYIAYTLSLLTSLTGAAFTMFYSMIWGTEKSNKWITSVVVSLVQDIFFIQPLKVIIVASLLSILLRKPPEEDREEVQGDEVAEISSIELEDSNPVEDKLHFSETLSELYTPPDPLKVAIARRKKVKEVKMWRFFFKFALHLVFALLLSVVCYGRLSSDRFRLNKNMKDTFNAKINKVKNVHTFWWWCMNSMLPGLYSAPWYNGRPFEEDDFFSNKRAFIVGLPRLRQLRIKPEPCLTWSAYPEFKRWFPRCYHEYRSSIIDYSHSALELIDVSPFYADIGTGSSSSRYNYFNNSSNGSSYTNRSIQEIFSIVPVSCDHTVKFQDATSLGTLPFVTSIGTYAGGGLVAELGYEKETAWEVITNLIADNWINRRTVIVLFEFVTFEPATNLFAFTRYSFEWLPTGGMELSYRTDPISFSRSINSHTGSIFLACYVIIVFILISSIYIEIREMRQLGWAYLKNIWSFNEWGLISLTITTMVIFFFKAEQTRKLVVKVHENPYGRMSFDYVALWTDIENVIIAMVTFLSTLKFLRILKFNKHISQLAKSITVSKGPMLSYSFVFLVALLAFAVMGNMLFGRSAYMFSTFTRSLVNVCEMILGKGTNYDDLEAINHFLGPFFIFFYFFGMTVFLMNFFVAILNDSFTDAREILEENRTEDSEMSDFIGEYAKAMLREISKELARSGAKVKRYETSEDNFAPFSKEAKERDFFLY